MGSKDVDFSIEFYAKTRSEHVSSHDHGDAEFADILFGVNSFQESKNDIPLVDDQDFSNLNDEKDENSNGSKQILEKNQSLKKTSRISMWRMINQHMVSGLAAESGDMTVQQVDEESKSETKELDDDANQETKIRKMFAIKLVRDAIEKILLPQVQDDQSTTSEAIPEQDISDKREISSDQKHNVAPNRWSNLKKVILLKRFVKELEKVKKFEPKKPRSLSLPSEQLISQMATETVSLRPQTAGDKRNSDEWMLDYALQKVVSELAPTQKRKVALLVKAFETVAPAQDDLQEVRSNAETQWVGLESSSFNEKKEESKCDLEKEQHIKIWHMIYQHVVTDIATKIGSDLLLDGEESTSSEEKNLQEVEDQTERSYRLQFTQSDAVRLVRESVDEILLPDDTQSVASDTAKDKNDSSMTKLQQQNSKNWGKLKKLIMVKRSIKALEGFRKLKPQTSQGNISKNDQEQERMDLRRQMTDERKKAEQWMLDYGVQHIVTKLTPARKRRVSMLVEAFEAVVPFPGI